jgi:hypothetical protein
MTIPYSAAELGNWVAAVNRIGTHTEFTPDGTAVGCLMRKPSNQNVKDGYILPFDADATVRAAEASRVGGGP